MFKLGCSDSLKKVRGSAEPPNPPVPASLGGCGGSGRGRFVGVGVGCRQGCRVTVARSCGNLP